MYVSVALPGSYTVAGWDVDLLAGFDRARIDLAQVDRLDLDTVDDEHARVVGDQIDEDARLRQHLDRIRHRRDLLDLVGQVRRLVAGDRHDEPEPDEDDPDGDAGAGEQQAAVDPAATTSVPMTRCAMAWCPRPWVASGVTAGVSPGAVIVGGSLAISP